MMGVSLKPAVESLPEPLRQRLVDYAGTNHDDHLCCEDGQDCEEFDALVREIVRYAESAGAG